MEVWKTPQWWPQGQFSFIHAILEVNAANSKGGARDSSADPVLALRGEMAILMIENTINDKGLSTSIC